MIKVQDEIRWKGTPVCAGIAIGQAYFYQLLEDDVPAFTISPEDREGEIERYRKAFEASRDEVEQLRQRMEAEGAVEGAAILEAHQQLLQDPALTTCIEDQIRVTGRNAEALFKEAVAGYESHFLRVSDPYLRERVVDLRDIARRVLGRLRAPKERSLTTVPNGSIVFALELSPSEAAEAEEARIRAFVTASGGETSHAAIMAKARGIPYVAHVRFHGWEHLEGAQVIVDGRNGEVILHPKESTISKYEEMQKQLSNYFQRLKGLGQYAPETVDGYRVELLANIEMFHELDILRQYGGSGVGLFRSEYLCLRQGTFPSEEEQFRTYQRLAESMRGAPVVVRTFDVGGDKFAEIPRFAGEGNPFLGKRAIRFMLQEHKAFKAQLRAILRASAYGDVRILFPMVSGLPELREATEYLEESKAELRRERLAFDEKIPVGCMIEVPSAAVTCDLLAKECDFLSIGTNDLIQYSLAVDRGNQALNHLYTPAHPSVIRLIRLIVAEGQLHNTPVTLCGEVAADPRFTPLLLGMGVCRFSVATRYLPIIHEAVHRASIVNAVKLAERVGHMATAVEVLDALIEEHQRNHSQEYFPGPLL